MRKLFGLLIVLALLPAVLAINVNVQKTSSAETMVYGIGQPAHFNLSITNNGPTDNFDIYTLGHFSFTSFENNHGLNHTILIPADSTVNITIPVYQRPDSNLMGRTVVPYYIQASDKSQVSEELRLNVINLDQALKISSGPVNLDKQDLVIYLENAVNFNFNNLTASFSSPFFNFKKVVSLNPNEKKSFEVQLKKQDFDKLMAGYYTMTAHISVGGKTADIPGKIEFVQQNNLQVQKQNYGFLITTQVIKKSNDGNTIINSETTVKKNIFSRLFTTYNTKPDQVQRQGATVYYTWTQRLNPGESSEVSVKTDWLIPIIIALLIVLFIYYFKKYTTEKVQVRKRVTFVKAKGGEFALKVTIIAEAREFVEKVKIIDRLPPLVKMYERFGGELPDKVSKDKKRLEWDFEYLDAGESRVMTYIVYSKVGVLGRFALPGTICRYEKEGKTKQSTSNKAFFLAEQKNRKYQH